MKEMTICYMGQVNRTGKERVTGQLVLFEKIETGLADLSRRIFFFHRTWCKVNFSLYLRMIGQLNWQLEKPGNEQSEKCGQLT